MWAVLHCIAWSYPLAADERGPSTANEEIRQAHMHLLNSLQFVLPCTMCCKNYARLIRGDVGNLSCVLSAGALATRDTLSRWMHGIHNCNRRIHGKPIDVSFSEARRIYGTARNRRAIWMRYGFLVLCYVAWNYPLATRAGARPKNTERTEAYRTFFCALPNVVSPVDAPDLWNAVRIISNELCHSAITTPTRRELTWLVTGAYASVTGLDAQRLYLDVCAHMVRVRPPRQK